MDSYTQAQEFTDLHWGTINPIAVMIASQFYQIRARGSYTLAVSDPQALAAQVPDPQDLQTAINPLAMSCITDLIGELSATAASLAQVTDLNEATARKFLALLGPKFSALGLQIKSLSLEAIERV
jgi:membrane protease subunit (stomatin/prohibitin family)